MAIVINMNIHPILSGVIRYIRRLLLVMIILNGVNICNRPVMILLKVVGVTVIITGRQWLHP